MEHCVWTIWIAVLQDEELWVQRRWSLHYSVASVTFLVAVINTQRKQLEGGRFDTGPWLERICLSLHGRHDIEQLMTIRLTALRLRKWVGWKRGRVGSRVIVIKGNLPVTRFFQYNPIWEGSTSLLDSTTNWHQIVSIWACWGNIHTIRLVNVLRSTELYPPKWLTW